MDGEFVPEGEMAAAATNSSPRRVTAAASPPCCLPALLPARLPASPPCCLPHTPRQCRRHPLHLIFALCRCLHGSAYDKASTGDGTLFFDRLLDGLRRTGALPGHHHI